MLDRTSSLINVVAERSREDKKLDCSTVRLRQGYGGPAEASV
jgi:hypothetical protein